MPLRQPKEKLHAIFVDYVKAFDTVNRSKLLTKLEHLVGKENPIAQIAKDIMTNNSIQIDDTVTIFD